MCWWRFISILTRSHIASLRKGGIVLYDSDHVQPKPEWEKDYRHVGVPISSRTIEAIGGTGKDKGKNIFALGLVARMFDLNVPKLERLISERFGGKDESVVKNALGAFHAGYGYSLGNILETFQFVEAKKKTGQQVVMTGNEALAYGLIAAGVRFGAAYPITPWSEVMELLRRELPKYGGTFVQCEDEIASVCMAIGRRLGRARGRDRLQRPGHFPQDRSHRLGRHGRSAPGGYMRRSARRPFHRHAHQRRAIRLEHGLLWRARRLPRAWCWRPPGWKIVSTPRSRRSTSPANTTCPFSF